MAKADIKEITQQDAIDKLGFNRSLLYRLRKAKTINSWTKQNIVYYSLSELKEWQSSKKEKKEQKKTISTKSKPADDGKASIKFDLEIKKLALGIRESEQRLKSGKQKILDDEYEKIESYLKSFLDGLKNIFKAANLSKNQKMIINDEVTKLLKRL